MLLYSFSLAIKQIAIFIAPLYLIWEYQRTRSITKTLLAGVWIVSIPLFASLPFLFWNAEGFVKSIAFSATRTSLNQFGAPSFDSLLNLSGLLARLPFLMLLGAAYFAPGKSRWGAMEPP